MWSRVPVHSTGNQAPGHSSLPSPLPAAACDIFSRNLGGIKDGGAEGREGRFLNLGGIKDGEAEGSEGRFLYLVCVL